MVEGTRFRSQRNCPHLMLVVLSFWILCLLLFFTHCLKTRSLVNPQQRSSVFRDGSCKVCPELSPSVASLRGYQKEPGNATFEKSRDSPKSRVETVNFVGPRDERTLADCRPRLLVDAGCKAFSKPVERLPSAGVRMRSLYPDKPDTDLVECRLKTAPVKRAQLFSYQDDWFRFSIMAEAASTHPVGVTSDAETVTSFPDPGSTHKWLVILDGGQKAIFKPKWYAYNSTTSDWFLGFEFHSSEILAFHLDTILGFGRFPVTVEREFSIHRDILGHASPTLRQKFQRKSGEWCLKDKCYFCTSQEETCSVDGTLSGSLSHFVPGHIEQIPHPWNIKEYHRHLRHGFNNRTHCDTVQRTHPYFLDKQVFLDLVDMNVFDYLAYHFDSKFYVLRQADQNNITLHVDRGRAFTRHDRDDMINMLALWQCCTLRRSTWETLKILQKETLSRKLRMSLSVYNKLQNGLPATLYQALDRRLAILINTVSQCIANNGESSVLL